MNSLNSPNSSKVKRDTPVKSSHPSRLLKTKSSSSLAPISNEDILKAINSLQQKQDQMLSQSKSYADTYTAQFKDLNAKLSSLSTQITELKAENNSLHDEITSLKNKVKNLELSPQIDHSSFMPKIIRELSDRERCCFNLIAHGVPESTSSVISARVTDDINHLKSALEPFSVSLPPDFKLIRLGKVSTNSPRPLKIIFSSKDVALSVLSSYSNARKSIPKVTSPFNIVRDKTSLERELLRSCHRELDRRLAAGEKDINISYVNGIPSIVKLRSKNGNSTSRNQRLVM